MANYVPGLGDLARMSRVWLEAVLRRAVVVGNVEHATALREELAGRTWQHTNPYAEPDAQP